jgi:meiotically up-regulated gene 157 (Mug157) protein
LDDAFQANYTLDFIIEEQYSEEIVAQAKDLKEEIRRVEEKKKLEQEQREEDINQIDIEGGGNEEKAEEPEETPYENEHQESENENPQD